MGTRENIAQLQGKERAPVKVQGLDLSNFKLDGKDIIKAVLGDYTDLLEGTVAGDALGYLNTINANTLEKTPLLGKGISLMQKVKNAPSDILDSVLKGLQSSTKPASKSTEVDQLFSEMGLENPAAEENGTLSEIFGLLRAAAKR